MSASRKAKPSTARRAPAPGGATAPLIAVDVGNTETQVGRFLAGELEESWRVTSGRATTDELRLQLEAMLKTGAAGCSSVVCSVVPSLTQAWIDALRAVTGRDAFEVTAADHRPANAASAIGNHRAASDPAWRCFIGVLPTAAAAPSA